MPSLRLSVKLTLPLLAAGTLALGIAGCAGGAPPQGRSGDGSSSPWAGPKELANPLAAARPLIAKVNQLGFRLASATPPDAGGNALVSPFSVYTALAQLKLASEGETRTALERALGLQGIAEESQVRGMSTLSGVLAGTGEFTTANGLWLMGNLPTDQNFLNRLQEATKAEVNVRPAPSAAVLDEINNWVEAKTRGRVKQIFDRLDPAAVVVLTNALAFDGQWQQPFDPSGTEDRPFRTPTGTVSVPSIRDTVMVRSAESSAGRMVSIPFEEEAFSLLVFLPAKESRLDGPWIDAKAFTDLAGDLQTQEEMTVQLPKFQALSSVDLAVPFAKIGLSGLFESANLGRLSPDLAQGTRISQAQHRTFLELDERGVRAAAATATEATASASDEFVVDRPFQYAIRHTNTGLLLLLGRCADPRARP